MSIIFIILVLLAFVHLIYEGILAPSRRLELRCAVFAERDNLRRLKMERPGDVSAEAFHSVHDMINTAIQLIPILHPSTLYEVDRAFREDENLRRSADRRRRIIEGSGVDELKEISHRTSMAVRDALFTNSAVLFVYIVPIFLALAFLKKLTATVRSALTMPPHKFERLVHSHEEHLAM